MQALSAKSQPASAGVGCGEQQLLRRSHSAPCWEQAPRQRQQALGAWRSAKAAEVQAHKAPQQSYCQQREVPRAQSMRELGAPTRERMHRPGGPQPPSCYAKQILDPQARRIACRILHLWTLEPQARQHENEH